MVEVTGRNHAVKTVYLLLCMSILIGTVPRMARLNDVPGLEHDEALICLGARDIVEQHALPMTGDKVYEGPLLEYLAALFMLAGGVSVLSARSVMAVSGILAIAAVYWAGKTLAGHRAGLFSAMLMLFSAWHLAASRVIYACNLSQLFIPIWIGAIALCREKRTPGSLVAAGLALGLAANGRFTAYLLIVPALIIILRSSENRKRMFHAVVFSIASVVPSLPLILYNARHAWPAAAILTGPGQSHLTPGATGLTARLGAFGVAFVQALTGSRYWLDGCRQSGLPVVILPVVLLAGILTVLKKQNTRDNRWIVWCLIYLLAAVPVFTKVVPMEDGWSYHPHYLDLVMPFGILLSGLALQDAEKRRKWTGWLAALGIVSWQAYLLYGHILPDLNRNGPPGRWNGHSSLAAQCIRQQFDAENTTVIVPWQFGKGYPEIAFLLGDYRVIPVLDSFHAKESPDGTRSRIVSVSPLRILPSPPWVSVTCAGSPAEIYTVESPGFYINGTMITEDGTRIRIQSVTDPKTGEPWPAVTIETDAGSHRVRIDDRADYCGPHPVFAGAVFHVSPRHAGILDSFRTAVLAHRIIGTDPSGATWILTLPASGIAGMEKSAMIQREKKIVSGKWHGLNEFY